MSELERYDAVVIGSGEGGKYLAWHMAQGGQRTAVVERRWRRSSSTLPVWR
jgi:pyruvate/2-oxoglutarate dehydrogenase complex dihydrolipoamide dehydrogenase (E3) component